jgi:hypothetical protein
VDINTLIALPPVRSVRYTIHGKLSLRRSLLPHHTKLTHQAASVQVPPSTPGRWAARRGPEEVILADGSQYSVGGISACTPMAVEAAYQLLRSTTDGLGAADLKSVLAKVLQVCRTAQVPSYLCKAWEVVSRGDTSEPINATCQKISLARSSDEDLANHFCNRAELIFTQPHCPHLTTEF